jgi:hypothetical protein
VYSFRAWRVNPQRATLGLFAQNVRLPAVTAGLCVGTRVERILTNIGEATEAPGVWPAGGPPQTERGIDPVDQSVGQDPWLEISQTTGDETRR